MFFDGIGENEEVVYNKYYKLLLKRTFNENIHTVFINQDDIENLGIFSKYLELLYIKICLNYREKKYDNNYLLVACGYLDRFRKKKEKIIHFLRKMKILTSNFTKGYCISPKHYRYCVNLSNKYIDFDNSNNIFSPLIWYHHDSLNNTYHIIWSLNMEYYKIYIQAKQEDEVAEVEHRFRKSEKHISVLSKDKNRARRTT